MPFDDGIANLLRFGLGMNAGEDSVLLPSLAVGEGNVTFSFPYDPRLRGLRWTVEATRNLTDWSNAEILFDSALHLNLSEADGWLALEEEISSTRRFYRLRLNEDPAF